MEKVLTENEKYVLWLVANAVNENLEYNKQNKEYWENSDNFILCLSKSQKKTLTNALKKL